MVSITDVLPSELLSRAFAFVPERSDIGACRLVCKTFHELASPFLIPEIVFALRLDALSRLRGIVRHPYFSRHVTTLVYDASRYSSEVAVDWNAYVSRCEAATREMVDEEYLRRRRRAADFIESLEDLGLGGGDAEFEMPGTAVPGDIELPDMRDDGDGDDLDDDYDYDYDNDDDEMFGMRRYYEVIYRFGCQKSFPDYYLRNKAQEALENKGIIASLLEEFFRRCPKLRSVIFTDYRGLARNGESYDTLCNRLFGLTLEPEHLGKMQAAWGDMYKIFDAVASVPGARIESFAMDQHPFSSIKPLLGDRWEDPQLPQLFHGFRGEVPDSGRLAGVAPVCSYLRNLVFAYLDLEEYRDFDVSKELQSVLASAAAILERLSITYSKDRQVPSRPDSITDFTSDESTAYSFLALQFPRLRCFEARHLQLPDPQPLRGFLERHASTLREVRLIEYCKTDRAGDPAKLASWAKENLRLAGVEIVTNSDLKALTTTKQIRIRDFTQTSVEMRKGPHAAKALVALEMRESVWLNGRPNLLKKTVDVADRARRETMEDVEWWLHPVSL